MESQRALLTMAMLCAATITAQFVGGKATRDALFLTSLDFTALPAMLIATSAVLPPAGRVQQRGARGCIPPAILVPAAFAVSGVLFLVEWILSVRGSPARPSFVYLHISGAGRCSRPASG